MPAMSRSVLLHNNIGTSDKVYRIELIHEGDNAFSVVGFSGRRNASLVRQNKVSRVPLDVAQRTFRSLQVEKTRKGYRPIEDPSASVSLALGTARQPSYIVANAAPVAADVVQAPQPTQAVRAGRLAEPEPAPTSPSPSPTAPVRPYLAPMLKKALSELKWVAIPKKHPNQEISIISTNGQVVIGGDYTARRTLERHDDGRLATAIKDFFKNQEIFITGVHKGDVLLMDDIRMWRGNNLTAEPYGVRLHLLELALTGVPLPVRLTPHAYTLDDKLQMMEEIAQRDNIAGIEFINTDANLSGRAGVELVSRNDIRHESYFELRNDLANARIYFEYQAAQENRVASPS